MPWEPCSPLSAASFTLLPAAPPGPCVPLPWPLFSFVGSPRPAVRLLTEHQAPEDSAQEEGLEFGPSQSENDTCYPSPLGWISSLWLFVLCPLFIFAPFLRPVPTRRIHFPQPEETSSQS